MTSLNISILVALVQIFTGNLFGIIRLIDLITVLTSKKVTILA